MRSTAVVWMSLMLAVAVLGYMGAAAATDQPAAKTAKVTVTGKIETKVEKVAGKDQTQASIVVATAKGAGGKDVAGLAGKTLKLTGPKASDAAKYAGKEVELRGIVKGDEFSADMIMLRPAMAAPHK